MVRRLVQKQNIRISKQRLGQKHLNLQRAYQILHQLMVKLRLYAKAI